METKSLVLYPWSVVTITILGNPLASADLAALWGCLGYGVIAGFGLRDLDEMGVLRGNTCIYLGCGLGHIP
jgi:hypothetical protein